MMARRRTLGFRVPEQLLLPWSPQATVSASHVARMLDVCLRTVYRMVEAGEILGYKVRDDKKGRRSSSPLRINYDSVIAHIESMHAENGLEKRF